MPGLRCAALTFVSVTLTGCPDDGVGADGDETGTTTSGSTSGGPSTTSASGTADSGTGSTTEGTTGATDGSTTSAGPVCGDGIQDADEVCDDGDTDDSNGCSADCLTATCLVPISHATVQEGEDDALCTTVWIMPGTYTENVAVDRDIVLEQVPLGDVTIDGGGGGTTIDIAFGDVELRGLIVTGGEATQGGGIRKTGGDALTLVGSTVTMNTVSGSDAQGAGIWSDTFVTLDDSSVNSNAITGDGATTRGAGIFISGGELLVTSGSEVMANTIDVVAVDADARGGGIYATGTDVLVEAGSLVALNTITLDGTGGSSAGAFGGGVAALNGSVTVNSASVETNTATATGAMTGQATAGGGGVSGSNADLVLGVGAALDGNEALADSGEALARGGGAFLTRSSIVATEASIASNLASALTDGSGGSPGAEVQGGAVYFLAPTTSTPVVRLADIAVADNRAVAVDPVSSASVGRGGGLFVQNGQTTTNIDIVRSTLSGNEVAADTTAHGGAIFAQAGSFGATVAVVVVNSTLSGNIVDGSGSLGGALHASAPSPGASISVDIASSTLTLNEALGASGQGGGVFGTAAFSNSIAYGNVAASGPECSGVFDSGGHNVIGDTTDCLVIGTTTGNLVGSDPMLGALMDNGGPTQTHALPAGSPAENAANPAGCTDLAGGFLAVDQRGMDRVFGGACDIGAFEYQ